jgi:anaerobic ribonucleoside-triphosphate reductase activating protein
MPEITWLIDEISGDLLVEGLAPDWVPGLLGDLLPPAIEMGCARPTAVLPPPLATTGCAHAGPTIRMAGYYHNSLVEGPGRRSCALLSGCDLGCIGCWVPHLHPADAGTSICVGCVADALLDPAFERDGISLLGGDPFFQPDELWALVQALRARRCPHLLVYSGYTFERLQRMALTRSAIAHVLADIDILIDGPFIAVQADRASPWTGSGNQRVIQLAETRQRGELVLYPGSMANG